MMTPVEPQRYSSFDALRASMMLLGVVIHSATAYCTLPDVWWLKDPSTSRVMDALVLWLHLFRLPVFFVMAGFFAAMLIEKRGWQGFIENRTARLFLPLLAGMFTVYPFLRCISVYFWNEKHRGDGWGGVSRFIHGGRLGNDIEPAHFWFLQILLFICLAAAPLSKWLNGWLSHAWFRAVLVSRLAPFLFAIPTFATLAMMDVGLLDTPHDFTPPLRIYLAYAVFFTFGWGLWLNRDLLARLKRGGWPEVVCTVPMIVPIIILIEQRSAGKLGVAALNALAAWLMVYGLISIFLRLERVADPRWRYLSDSAYWVYMAHPVVLVLIEIPLMHAPLHPLVKFTLGILIAVPVLLVTYDRWIRPTWVGALLNGRRYERYSATCGQAAAQDRALSAASAARQAVSARRI